MDIDKLNNIGSNNINKSNKRSKGSESKPATSNNTPTDKTTLGDYQFRNNDQLFAKLELEKLEESSSNKFKEIKSQVAEYLEASDNPSADASETEMGQKINDPSVWGDIAHKILQ